MTKYVSVSNTRYKSFIEYLNNPAEDKSYTMLNTQISQAVAFKEATSQQIPVTKFMNDLVSESCHVKTKFVCIVTLYQFIVNKYVYTNPTVYFVCLRNTFEP
jgi:hypothetical protein